VTPGDTHQTARKPHPDDEHLSKRGLPMNHATAGRATLTRPARRQAGDPAIRADPAARRSTRARDGSPGSGCRRLESVDQVRGDREAAGLELVWKTLSGSRYRISVRQAQNDRQAGRASADRPGRRRRADAVSGPVGHALECLCELVQVDAFEVAEQVAAGAGVVTGLSLFQAASPASVRTALKERASRGPAGAGPGRRLLAAVRCVRWQRRIAGSCRPGRAGAWSGPPEQEQLPEPAGPGGSTITPQSSGRLPVQSQQPFSHQ
jgi:hypothetical protein